MVTAEQFRTWIGPISQLVGVLVVGSTIIGWGVKLQDRVDKLETQIQALLVSPVKQDLGPSSGSLSATSKDVSVSNTTVCANLAERVGTVLATDHTIYSDGSVRELRSLMDQLGCFKTSQSK
jgi:hypothetical protein